jgi:hypothetical protein
MKINDTESSTGFDHTAINRLLDAGIDPDCPQIWALWDKTNEAWLADENGVRMYRGSGPGSQLGKWKAELVVDLLSLCCCPNCKHRVEARPYDPSVIKTRSDVKIPFGRDF